MDGVVEVGQKVVLGLTASGVGWFLMFPVKNFVRSIKAQWIAMRDGVVDLKQEMVHQRTNCLSTLQKQGDEQISLLKEVSGTLKEIHLSQAEMSGYMKAKN